MKPGDDDGRPNFPRDAFAGTADFYQRYRVPYPRVLLEDLFARTALPPGQSRLLDLACGPGRATLALAPWFRDTVAIDLEPEMVAAARDAAVRLGLNRITWLTGRAEELVAEPASFDLITIGEAFHRLDQPLITASCHRWLKPGGTLATLGSIGFLNGKEPWKLAVTEVVQRWTPPAESVGKITPFPGSTPEHNERVFRQHGFAGVASFRFTVPLVWTIDSILGFLHSTSFCSLPTLGALAEPFAADLRQTVIQEE